MKREEYGFGLTDNVEIYHVINPEGKWGRAKCGVYIYGSDRRKSRPKDRRVCKHCNRK